MSDKSPSRLKVSREGLILIKSFEGFRPQAVRRADGRWAIGYGHTASAREGLVVDEADAELLLQYDLLPVVRLLNERAGGALNQHQFDAIASFAISVGLDRFMDSDVLRRLESGQTLEAADALLGWPEEPAPDAALRRRFAERALFAADPAAEVRLDDLLASPLAPTPAQRAVPASSARAAAVTSTPVDVAPPAPPLVGPLSGLFDRVSPYRMPSGPLPGFPSAVGTTPASLAAAVADGGAPADAPAQETAVDDSPPGAGPSPSPEPTLSPFPTAQTASALASGDDDAVSAASTGDGGEPTGAHEGPSVAGDARPAVLAKAPKADSKDDGVIGAFVTMGLVGLGSCAASAAAFRKAMSEAAAAADFTVIGWVLAVIGLTCVGVSAWTLYRRWGRPD